MCFRVDCKKCGGYSWGGCGKHLAALFASIEEGKHCMCKSWPGIPVPTHQRKATSQQPPLVSPAAPTTTTQPGIEKSQKMEA